MAVASEPACFLVLAMIPARGVVRRGHPDLKRVPPETFKLLVGDNHPGGQAGDGAACDLAVERFTTGFLASVTLESMQHGISCQGDGKWSKGCMAGVILHPVPVESPVA